MVLGLVHRSSGASLGLWVGSYVAGDSVSEVFLVVALGFSRSVGLTLFVRAVLLDLRCLEWLELAVGLRLLLHLHVLFKLVVIDDLLVAPVRVLLLVLHSLLFQVVSLTVLRSLAIAVVRSLVFVLQSKILSRPFS